MDASQGAFELLRISSSTGTVGAKNNDNEEKKKYNVNGRLAPDGIIEVVNKDLLCQDRVTNRIY